MKKINALAALSSAAMAIPSNAEVAPTDRIMSYRYTSYQEAESPRERTFTSETERYNIDVHQLGLRLPYKDDWYISSNLQYETLSGASPTQTYKNEDGRSVLLMSGASIEEKRIDFNITPRRYFKHGTAAGTLALSKENDYRSLALGTDGTLDIFNKHTTLIGAVSFSNDTLSPTDSSLSTARTAADGRGKQKFSVYEGVSQIINKYSVLQIGIGFDKLSGYLSDPYKFEDRRPGKREQYTLAANYRHFYDVWDGAAIHADYRFYRDDWGINSQTLEAQWVQKVALWGINSKVSPLIRYYQQTEADFYSLTRDDDESSSAPEFKSSDYRLSSYGAITLGVDTSATFQQWTVHFNLAQYFSREELALFKTTDDETPALVNFTTFTLGVDYSF